VTGFTRGIAYVTEAAKLYFTALRHIFNAMQEMIMRNSFIAAIMGLSFFGFSSAMIAAGSTMDDRQQAQIRIAASGNGGNPQAQIRVAASGNGGNPQAQIRVAASGNGGNPQAQIHVA